MRWPSGAEPARIRARLPTMRRRRAAMMSSPGAGRSQAREALAALLAALVLALPAVRGAPLRPRSVCFGLDPAALVGAPPGRRAGRRAQPGARRPGRGLLPVLPLGGAELARGRPPGLVSADLRRGAGLRQRPVGRPRSPGAPPGAPRAPRRP